MIDLASTVRLTKSLRDVVMSSRISSDKLQAICQAIVELTATWDIARCETPLARWQSGTAYQQGVVLFGAVIDLRQLPTEFCAHGSRP